MRWCGGGRPQPGVRPLGGPLRPAAPEVVERALHPARVERALVRGDRLEVERRRLDRVVGALAGQRVVEHHDVGHPEHRRAARAACRPDGVRRGRSGRAAPTGRRPGSRRRAGPPRRGSARRAAARSTRRCSAGVATSSQQSSGPPGTPSTTTMSHGPVDGQRRAGEALADALDASGSAARARRVGRHAVQVGQRRDPLRRVVRRPRGVDLEQRRQPAPAGRDDDQVVVAGQVLEVLDGRHADHDLAAEPLDLLDQQRHPHPLVQRAGRRREPGRERGGGAVERAWSS